MIHDFGIVWNERALLLNGLANTAILSTLAAIAALLLGFILTPALMSKRGAVSGAARAMALKSTWHVMSCSPGRKKGSSWARWR